MARARIKIDRARFERIDRGGLARPDPDVGQAGRGCGATTQMTTARCNWIRILCGAMCAPAAFPWAAPCAATHATASAEYPVKSIRIIVASSPGTADDFFARVLGAELAAFYRQRIIIDNRAGAGGLIGNRRMSHAKADGYTLGMRSDERRVG